MSTKTLRKRIALATVAALGAGVLSLVSTTAANADSHNTAATATATQGYMNIATTASTSGAAVTTSAGQKSLGLLTYGDVAGGTVAGTTQTATILSSGAIVLYTTPGTGSADAGGSAVKFVVGAGGYISGATGPSVSGDLKSAAMTSGISVGNASIAVSPVSGATSFTVAMYTDNTSDTAASLLDGTYTGSLTLAGQITVTVAATSAAGVLAPSKSGVWYTGSYVRTGTTYVTSSLTSDSSTLASPGVISYGGDGYLNVRVRDIYGSAITGAGFLQVSATNGAIVAIGGTRGGTPPTAAPAVSLTSGSTDFKSITAGASADDYLINVEQPSSGPMSTVVTVSWNGTVIGSKSFTFAGKIAKVTLSSAVNGKTSDTTSGHNTAIIAFADSAGNTVYPTAAYLAQDSTNFNGIVTSVSMTTTPDSSGTVGKVTFGCGPNAGKGQIGVTYTNTDGTVVTSNYLPVTCSGDAVNYSAAYDKSTYKPGEVATLTITFKDSKGNLANDYTSPNTTAGVISTGGVTAITSPATTANGNGVLTNGTLVYRQSVGTTTGTFTNTVTFSVTDTAATAAGLKASGPATATLTIADDATSLNDVLKGIVSLIASINKQIAALAKLVTKKK